MAYQRSSSNARLSSSLANAPLVSAYTLLLASKGAFEDSLILASHDAVRYFTALGGHSCCLSNFRGPSPHTGE